MIQSVRYEEIKNVKLLLIRLGVAGQKAELESEERVAEPVAKLDAQNVLLGNYTETVREAHSLVRSSLLDSFKP